jgi:hypothetical protein
MEWKIRRNTLTMGSLDLDLDLDFDFFLFFFFVEIAVGSIIVSVVQSRRPRHQYGTVCSLVELANVNPPSSIFHFWQMIVRALRQPSC